VGMGILWGYPQDFLWLWDGCGDRNSVPTAALPNSHTTMHFAGVHFQTQRTAGLKKKQVFKYFFFGF